jgi:tRNA (guanosine-2'-O-)-methyltransferase
MRIFGVLALVPWVAQAFIRTSNWFGDLDKRLARSLVDVSSSSSSSSVRLSATSPTDNEVASSAGDSKKPSLGEQQKALAERRHYDGQENPDWDKWEFGSFSTSQRSSDFLDERRKVSQSAQDDSMSMLNETDVNSPPFWEAMSLEDVRQSIDCLSKYITENRRNKFEEVLSQRTDRIRFAFENPSNANNIWAALRTFDIFGIQYADVISDPQAYDQSWRRTTMKTAMGAQKWLTLKAHHNTTECIKSLKDQGYRILASDIHTSSKSLYDIDFSTRGDSSVESSRDPSNREQVDGNDKPRGFVIVMGNEEKGVTEEMKALADERFYIPMKGFAESFNLAAASAVSCSVMESRGALSPSLTEEQRTRIMLMWIARTVPRSILYLKTAGLLEGDEVLWGSVAGYTTKP